MTPMTVLDAVALEDAALTAEELATACAVHTRWVVERVESGLLGVGGTLTTTTVTTTTTSATSPMRFCSADLRRARRLLALERGFDANPELAALAVDLMEELDRLRRLVKGGA